MRSYGKTVLGDFSPRADRAIANLTCPAVGDLRGAGEGGAGLGASPEALPPEKVPHPLRMAGRSGTAPPGGRPWTVQTSLRE